MSADCCAAIVDTPGAEFRLAPVDLDELRPNEICVDIVAAGICHTDTSIRDSDTRTQKPVVLGHEGAGIVRAVGDAVTRCKVGDRIVTSFGSCGHCVACIAGRPAYCVEGDQRNFGGCRPDGSRAFAEQDHAVGSHFFGQSAFSTRTIVNERSAVPVTTDVPLQRLAPLGCGLQTGAGAIFNSLSVHDDDSVLVFGAGSVGLAAVMAARIVGAKTIVAVDLQKARLDLAAELGATGMVQVGAEDVQAALQRIAPNGFSKILDTTGRPDMIVTALERIATGGVCGSVGMPHAPVEFSMRLLMSKGAALRGIIQGDSDPMTMLPKLIDLHERGLFPFERLVRYYRFEEINQAVGDMLSGAVIKPILCMPDSPPDA
tara:strand:+ start:455 stop:1573 length:1119 start_codon:yes stop_codon:yes gene_type:complete